MASKNSIDRTPWHTVMLFLLPGLIGLALFVFVPIIITTGMAFTNYSGGSRFRFIGLRNFQIAFQNKDFIKSIFVTFQFVFWSVIFQIGLGLGVALLLNTRFKAQNFFRGIMYMPNVLSSVAISLVFMMVFDPTRGPINQYLASIGITPLRWLAGEKTALPTIIIVAVWQNFGYYMVLFLGGLQTINKTLYEAAEMDGAGPVRRFFAVTLPGLSPIMFLAVTMAIIRAFQVFDQVFTMTGGQYGGGPAGATSVLVFNIYKHGFGELRFGYASAEAIVLLAIVLIITIVQNIGQKKWVTYDIV